MAEYAASARAAIGAEWIKMRTLRSTVWALVLTFVLSTGSSAAIGLAWRSGVDRVVHFDPTFVGLYSLTFGQLALVVFGVLHVGSEYSSQTIRASLAAVPRRGVFFGGKVLTGVLAALGVSAVTVAAAFAVAQAALGPYRTTIGADGVLPRLVGACGYLTMICAFSMGVTALLRSSTVALGILLPLLFLGSQGLGNIPGLKAVLQYLPDQAGMELMRLWGPDADPRFGHAYGAWGALAILAAWTATALACGRWAVCRRDA